MARFLEMRSRGLPWMHVYPVYEHERSRIRICTNDVIREIFGSPRRRRESSLILIVIGLFNLKRRRRV